MSEQRERRYKDDKLNRAAAELWNYRRRQREISEMQCTLDEYKERYEVGAVRYDKISVQGGERKDKLADIAIMWADLDTEVRKRQAEAERELWAIREKLKRLSSMQSRVLELYYIKGFSVNRIARSLDYSAEWVKTTKFTALKKYARL